MSDTYSIREVLPEDINDFWRLRLQALRDHPEAFGSDYETSLHAGPMYTEGGYFDPGVNRLFAAFTQSRELVAQAGVYQEAGKRNHIAQIISVYTHPDHRGKGLARLLLQAGIDHLQKFPEITSVRISVNSRNKPAVAIYERYGFRAWGEEPDAIRTADGSCHNELHMVLTSGARRT